MPSPSLQVLAAYARKPAAPAEVLPAKLYALRDMNVADYFATAAGGGELGSGSGFGIALGFAPLPRAGGANAIILGKGANYYELYLNNPNQLMLNMVSASTSIITLYHTFLTGTDTGRFHSIIIAHEGALVALYVDGRKSTSAAIVGNRQATAGTYLGRRVDGTYPLNDSCLVTPPIAWHGVLSEAAIKELSDSFRTAYDWPKSIAGATLTHRHSLLETLGAATVVDGQIAPASLADTVTRAPADALARVGAPKVSVPASREGSTRYGMLPYESYYQADALIPATTRMVMHVRFIINPSGASVIRGVISNDSSGGGFWIGYTSDGVAAPSFMPGWRGSSYYYPSIPGHVSDLNVPVQIAIVYIGGGTSTAYIKRLGQPVAVLGSSAGSTITSGPQKLCFGYWPYSNYQGFGTTILDATWVTDTVDVPLSEVTDAMDRTELTNEITGFEARPYHRYIPHLDIVANGGPDLPLPATILDRPHTLAPVHLTRVGTPPVFASRRVERDFGYEPQPITRGAKGFSPSNHFVSQSPVTVGAPPCWMTIACIINTASATAQVLASSHPATAGSGMLLSFTNGGLTFTLSTTGGTAYSVNYGALPALGRLALIGGWWCPASTTTKMALALNGLSPVGGSNPSPPGTITPTSLLYIGHEAAATARSATGTTILGVAIGTGNVTASQFRAQYEAWVALDGANVPGIPGQTSHQWQLVNPDGTIPATVLDQVGGNHLTRVGALTVEPRYVRDFAA